MPLGIAAIRRCRRFGAQPGDAKLAQILEDRIGGARHKPVVDAFQVADKIEIKRTRFDAIDFIAAQMLEMHVHRLGLYIAENRLLAGENTRGAHITGHEDRRRGAKILREAVEHRVDGGFSFQG